MNNSNPKADGAKRAGRDRLLATTAVVGLFLVGFSSVALSQCSATPGREVSASATTTNASIVPASGPATNAHPASGVITPNAAQQAAENTLPVVNQVDLNDLALQRINAERKAQGLPPIQAPTAAPGHEINSVPASTNPPTSNP